MKSVSAIFSVISLLPEMLEQHRFCARDHLGVKPFFSAHLGQTLIFSNTLDCIRRHPAISDKLNDLAIADFLLFDLNQNPATLRWPIFNGYLPRAPRQVLRQRVAYEPVLGVAHR